MVDYAALIAKHGGVAPAATPDFAALIAKHGGVMPAAPAPARPEERGLTAERAVPVALGAAAPTAVGALGGLALGGASVPAALGGAALLGGAELVGNVYNLARGAAGYAPVKTPFEYIRGATQRAFPSTAPRTPEEEMLAAGVEGGLGAASGAGAARSAVNAMAAAGRAAPRILNVLAAQPVAQTVTGAAAPVAGELAKSEGADPYTQFGASILGGMAAGKSVAALGKIGRTAAATISNIGVPTSAQLRESAAQAFETSKKAGLTYDSTALSDFTAKLEKTLEDYDPDTDTLVSAAFKKLNKKAEDGNTSLSDLHSVRRFIGNRLRNNPDRNVRRMGGEMTDALDDFVTDINNATTVSKTAMNVPEVTATFQDAINKYRALSQSTEIEQAMARAARKPDFGSAIQTQMQRIADNPRRLNRFAPEQREAIQSIAAGEFAPGVISDLSKFAPSMSVPGLLKGAAQGGIGYAGMAAGLPIIPAVMGGLAAGGLAASAGRNLLARGMARNLATATRGGQLIAPTQYPGEALRLPAFAQGLNAMANQ